MTSSLDRRRRRRLLDEEERRLWQKVVESVTPLVAEDPRPRAAEAPPVSAAAPPPEAPAPAPPPAPPPAPSADPPPVAPSARARAGWKAAIHVKHGLRPEAVLRPTPPALAPMDDRTRRRLVRGAMAIDERLDLHGLTQAAAHAALWRFLNAARGRGARVVLVITGKGKAADDAFSRHERGVLRRSLPHWLGDPSWREVVIGFEEAHHAHGGAGAFYVRLRRRRDRGEER